MKPSKFVKLIRFLMRLSPYIQLVLVRWIYNNIAAKNNSEKNIFLNYGYLDEDTPLLLDPEDEPNRLFIQLYNRAVTNISLEDKDIAEIGCGQGAGGLFLTKYKQPRSYTGVDLSEKAIAFCQRHNQYPNVQWLQGRAAKLPIPDESMDVVINIESSHFYPSMEQFLSEVKRILRPNGYMAFVDLRESLQIETLNQYFNDSGLQILQQADITPQVLASLTRLSDRRKAYINSAYAGIWRRSKREMSAVKGSPIYNGFINGQQKYVYYLLQKS